LRFALAWSAQQQAARGTNMKPIRVTALFFAAATITMASATMVAQGQDKKKKDEPPKPGVHLTVYHENFALVKDRRELPDVLRKGVNTIQFRDVAATIDPTSVHFRSLTDAGAQVLEQNYEFDLVNAEKLLQKYIDQKLTVHLKDGKAYEGVLLSYDAQRLVLAADKAKGPIFLVERGDNIKRIQFSKLPEGLLTRPTLVWEVEAKQPGKHLVEVSYIANQIRWRSDYNLSIAANDKFADLSGWVTIENQSGAGYKDATVKLMAGETRLDVQRMVWGSGAEYYKLVQTLPPTGKIGKETSETLGDYRVYRLREPTTVANNQIKQVEYLRANKVPVTRTYLYDGAKLQWHRHTIYPDQGFGVESNKKVNVLLEIQNRADQNLGFALPLGKVRAYKKDAQGALEFIGEDLIKHTARDERLVLYLGDAFDIVGERKQISFKKVAARHIEEKFEIKIRNHKKEAVEVKVMEKLYRGHEWKVANTNHPYDQLDSRTIVFTVNVAPDKEKTVTYQVDYRW
jgi:hypothetical protein